MKQVIYETKGRAREFNELAINLFTGCGHRCVYCYGANVTHQDKDAFERYPRPRISVADIECSARDWADCEYREGHRPRRVLLCFVTDPYQPVEQITELTRYAIKALHAVGLNVIILTKAGWRATRDFDLLTENDAFATTLTCVRDETSKEWEPGAAAPNGRIASLMEAHKRGIETWVSLEPVIYPEDSMALVTKTHEFVGHYKVGTMNYHPHGKSINWYDFGWSIKQLLDSLGAKYYFKKDLLKEMKALGRFQQTWACR